MTHSKRRRPRSPESSTRKPPAAHRTTGLWLSVPLVIVTAAVYAPVRHFSFLGYDDPAYVSQNSYVMAGFTLDGFVWAWTGIHQATWHPLTTLSHMLDCQLFGLNPGAHHLVNLAFHILTTILLFGFLTRVTGRPWRSACVAALFALHPLRVESVAWISERKDVVSGFFWMITLWAYSAYVRRPSARTYVWVLLAYIAALLSKPMVVTLPVVLLLLDVWPLARWKESVFAGSPPPRPLLLEKVPLVALAIGTSVVAFVTQRHAGALVPMSGSAPSDRLANAVVAYLAYLLKMLWPSRLAIFYPYEVGLPAWQIVGAATFLLTVSAFVLRYADAYPYLLTGWLWYLVALVPVIGLIRVGGHSMADRFTYLPLIGISIIVVWGTADLLDGWKYRQVAEVTTAALALGACIVLTAWQLEVWRDTRHLFEHALAVTRDNYVAHFMIGTVLLEEGRRDDAFDQFAEAARLEPSYYKAEFNMGIILAARGELQAARQQYLAALQANPNYSDAHNSLGLVLAAQGDDDAAIAQYREALRLDPDFGAAHNNLAATLAKGGRTGEAIAQYTDAIRLSPQHSEPHWNLAVALQAAGRLPEAIEQFRAAVQLSPALVDIRYRLAMAYLQAGDTRNAAAELTEVLRQRPNWPAAETALARLGAQPP